MKDFLEQRCPRFYKFNAYTVSIAKSSDNSVTTNNITRTLFNIQQTTYKRKFFCYSLQICEKYKL